jgi:predicted ester cyclase
MKDEDLIRTYYDHFNTRQLADAAGLLADDVRLEHVGLGHAIDGRDRYAEFAYRWLAAFPDSTLTIERIDRVRDQWYEVQLVGEGTQDGDFDMGPLGTIKATHRRGRFRFRHLLQVCDGRIASSTLSFDTQSMIRYFAGS